MNLTRALNKPYYLFRPAQLARRLAQMGRPTSSRNWQEARLPWGHSIGVNPHEAIGSSIVRTGVFDLPVTETIWRLLDRGELAVDVGANIGYMTSVMAARVGSRGEVMVFEPHPELFRHLSDNVSSWARSGDAGKIVLHDVALSDHVGTGRLYTGPRFKQNMGTATLRPPDRSKASQARVVEVSVNRLENMLHHDVALLKLDVEDLELKVLVGAGGLLREGRVRDILFEQLEPLPTLVSELLESHDYTVLAVRQRFTGVVLSPPSDATRSLWDAPTYLATNQPRRALERMRRSGWTVLRSGSRGRR